MTGFSKDLVQFIPSQEVANPIWLEVMSISDPWYHMDKQKPPKKDRTSGSRTLDESHPEGLTRNTGFSTVSANAVGNETTNSPGIDNAKSRGRTKTDRRLVRRIVPIHLLYGVGVEMQEETVVRAPTIRESLIREMGS